ncbi:conserved Plasmodium protein, unknown function [Plasmodium berghei]|uniref:Uncharacterized protein n=2 Tax=Plasmodium berghei TaxID=5821 RepID=A0A509AM08_PLABA|nr:conserved Plasmodium protein, unknown function [Plasmodium berghei ANKA]CXI44969.1 conserved Plasmodium protein, unknown function [Plasmodium berghei]SCM22587.1 conserved Plasmodium protein, unknown function [Plasmodium berghei]SCN25535.1 conserved Plasmodium protein, unknown function [Plasmodium berghei]SCO60491.1 conserved Plasmodium protein, unknown function [Plasmodium berghei]SCO62267.1 conserved Plasmodium protein, unknown function [Plasmodium berghei]|eukprot:XP_034421681.1 conserved Plasmodium protein, unknown function [Plasmodium berghei ANKA]
MHVFPKNMKNSSCNKNKKTNERQKVLDFSNDPNEFEKSSNSDKEISVVNRTIKSKIFLSLDNDIKNNNKNSTSKNKYGNNCPKLVQGSIQKTKKFDEAEFTEKNKVLPSLNQLSSSLYLTKKNEKSFIPKNNTIISEYEILDTIKKADDNCLEAKCSIYETKSIRIKKETYRHKNNAELENNENNTHHKLDNSISQSKIDEYSNGSDENFTENYSYNNLTENNNNYYYSLKNYNIFHQSNDNNYIYSINKNCVFKKEPNSDTNSEVIKYGKFELDEINKELEKIIEEENDIHEKLIYLTNKELDITLKLKQKNNKQNL